MGPFRPGLGVALAAVLVALGCQPPAATLDREGTVVVARPHMEFSDGRSPKGGVAFLVRTSRVLAVTSGHLARNLRKGATLVGLSLADANKPGAVLPVVALACEPGPTFDGLDYSSDVAVLVPGEGSLQLPPIELAATDARANETVLVVACPANGSASQIEIEGTVVTATPTLLHVKLKERVDGRGFAGAPILAGGKVVGMVQTVSGDAILATPREGVSAALARATREVPVGEWK